jgi:hypothetical protein
LSSRKASWCSSSIKEHCHHRQAIGTTTHGLIQPSGYMSICGNKYSLVIVDDYSRFTRVFFLHDKSVVQDTLKKFAKRVQNKFDTKIKKVRSDNGTEFKNTNIEKFLDEEALVMSSPFHILHNKMELLKEKIELSLKPQGQCLMNTKSRINFGRKQSTRHAMPLIAFIYTRS